MKTFDEWKSLYEKSPSEFELERQKAISSFLNSVPEEKRNKLQQLQWRIDMERKRHRTPLGSCIKLYEMMYDSFEVLRDHLNAFAGVDLSSCGLEPEERSTKVLKFPRASKSRAH